MNTEAECNQERFYCLFFWFSEKEKKAWKKRETKLVLVRFVWFINSVLDGILIKVKAFRGFFVQRNWGQITTKKLMCVRVNFFSDQNFRMSM